MRSKKNKKKLLIAICLGMIATMGVFNMMNAQKISIEALNKKLTQQQTLTAGNLQTQENPNALQNEITNTILAKTDIKIGEIITIDKIEKKEYKKSELPAGFFINENCVLGKITSQYVFAGKIITGEDIIAAKENSFNIPAGMRAITIPTSLIQGLASYIYIGSKIDLISVKSPSELIAQNIKIIALETNPDMQAAEKTPTPSAQAANSKSGSASDKNITANTSRPSGSSQVIAAVSDGKKSVSASKATGITVLIPVDTAKKVIDAMIEGKLQVLTRGNNDDKILKQTSSVHISQVSNIARMKDTSMLPLPPSGLEKLPSLPGVVSSGATSTNKPHGGVEVIEADKKRQVSFDD